MRKFLWWIVVISLGLFGLTLIIYGSSINENLDGDLYRTHFSLMTTDFDRSSNNVLHIPWNFFYDFSKNTGRVSLKLDERNWSLSYIDLRLPREIKNKSLEIYSIQNRKSSEIKARTKINFDENLQEGILYVPNGSIISISQFERNFTEEEIIIEFKFKNALNPNGRFQFTTIEDDDLNPYQYSGNVHFIFGNKYGCQPSCIDNFKFIEENSYMVGKEINLDFKADTKFSEFRLNTYSKNKLFWKNFWIAIGISLLVSSIFLILDLYSKKTFRLD
mgnify:FL=1